VVYKYELSDLLFPLDKNYFQLFYQAVSLKNICSSKEKILFVLIQAFYPFDHELFHISK